MDQLFAAEVGVVEPGDVLTYACEDCGSRWDIVVDDDDLTDDPTG